MEKTTKKMLRRNRHRAEFAGFSYFFGSLILAAACYFPMIYGVNLAGMGTGAIWVANFWKPFLLFTSVTTDLAFVVVNVLPSVLYAIILLVVTINLICVLAKMHRLYRKKPSEKSGYNRNVDTMEKMGKNFSCSFFTTVALVYLIHLLTGAKLTAFFYVAMTVAFFVHIIAGVKGAKTSLFLNGDKPVEDKRRWGRFAPFVRNLAQYLFVGVILYFLAKASIITNLFKLLNAGAFSELFANLTFADNFERFIATLVLPLVQVLILVFTFVLLKHATNTTEYNRKGRFGKGMKNFAIFSFFVFFFAAAYEVACYLFGCTTLFGVAINVYPTMNMLYVGIAGFAAFLVEVCMAKLPIERKCYKEAVIPEPVAEEPAVEEPAKAEEPSKVRTTDTIYTLPIKCITEPGVFMQPNGLPVMVMPMTPVTVQEPAPLPTPIPTVVPAPKAAEPVVVEETAPVVAEDVVSVEAKELPEAVVVEEKPVEEPVKVEEPAKVENEVVAAEPKEEEQEPVLDEATLARIKKAKELKAKWVDIGKKSTSN